jgi:hypothetical protein
VRVGNRNSTPIYTGIINVHTGEQVIPIEGYRLAGRGFYTNGMILMDSNGERAIIDVTNGEQIIPFGNYNIYQLLPGGFIVVSDGDYWRIERIQR